MKTPRRRKWVLIAVALTLLALRVWWVRPQALPHGPLLRVAEVRAGGYELVPRKGLGTAVLVRIASIEDYTPDSHFDFEEKLKGLKSRYQSVDERHHYAEYVGRSGRIQLHTALEADGFDSWCVFLPSQVSVDDFFVPELAILLPAERKEYTYTFQTIRITRI